MTISLTQAFNQFVNPWALNAIGWKYVRYTLFCLKFQLLMPESVSCVLRLAFPGTSLYITLYCGDKRSAQLCIPRKRIDIENRAIGRTLEETAALFDGEKPQQELRQLGGEAATLTFNMSRGMVTPIRRPEKSMDYGQDIYLDVRQSFTTNTQSQYDWQADSRRQSQESAIAVAI